MLDLHEGVLTLFAEASSMRGHTEWEDLGSSSGFRVDVASKMGGMRGGRATRATRAPRVKVRRCVMCGRTDYQHETLGGCGLGPAPTLVLKAVA